MRTNAITKLTTKTNCVGTGDFYAARDQPTRVARTTASNEAYHRSVNPPALGRRGEGWVVLQSIVIVAAVACAVIGPSWPNDSESWLRVIGFVLEAAGAGILIVSRMTLGRSFTPMPRPRDRSTLRTTGIYASARHPIYGGLLVLLLGLSFHRSPLVLAPTALLAGIFWLKSIREEAWLAERYSEYDAYRRATPRRFIPWIV